MTEEYVQAQLKLIAETAGDPESAHSLEDTLLWQYVKSRAVDDPVAALILKVDDIDFPRWCA